MKTKNYLTMLVFAGIALQACTNRESHEQSAQAVNDSTNLASPMSEGVKLNHDDDLEFIKKAASGSKMEVALGGIAQINGGSSRVKKFGDMMLADHSKAGDELKALAKTLAVDIYPNLLPEHQKSVDHLKTLHGVDFDKAYLKMMLQDHKKDVKDFEEQAENGSEATLKAFATKTLPVLKVHLDSAKSINSSMKKIVSPGNITEGTGKQPNN